MPERWEVVTLVLETGGVGNSGQLGQPGERSSMAHPSGNHCGVDGELGMAVPEFRAFPREFVSKMDRWDDGWIPSVDSVIDSFSVRPSRDRMGCFPGERRISENRREWLYCDHSDVWCRSIWIAAIFILAVQPAL